MNKDINNLLYIYLQRKLLHSVNNIISKSCKMSEEEKDKFISDLISNNKLIVNIPFVEARKIINKYYNIPLNLTTPILYIMQDLELIKIDGKFQSMKIEIINISKGKLISQSNKLYSVCL